MDYTTFVRKPFTVEAVEITAENMAELAQFIGVIETEEDGTPFIKVDHSKVPTKVYRVFVGYWMTKMTYGKTTQIRCYSPKIFRQQFVESTPPMLEWVEFLNAETEGVEEVASTS